MRSPDEIMREVDRRSENWRVIHNNMHTRRNYLLCPWCGNGTRDESIEVTE